MSNPLVDMQKPDVVFCIGTNMTECHPVAATGIKKAVARGSKLIVADPRRIKLAEIGRSLSSAASGFGLRTAACHGACDRTRRIDG